MRVKELSERLQDAARRAGFKAEFYGQREEHGLIALVREPEQPKAHVYISAGVHGDEPAGPLAVLDLLRRKAFRDDVAYYIVPLVNPLGLEAKTRENDKGQDVNRSYGPTPSTPEAVAHQAWLGQRTFDLALCLHEDFESSGFYLYELGPQHLADNDARRRTHGFASPARDLLAAGAEHLPLDMSPEIDGMPANEGLMQPPLEHTTDWRDDLPEAIHLMRHHTPWCYTFETPSTSANIVDRVACQSAAVEAAVNWLIRQLAEAPKTQE
ncbi:MAG: M14 family metallocarboxypeptidase [Verrucomicrobiota bacterium JB022]|nr:M14 family metallocarboxypeptidase [Verrucomicrobiota bacterium JB022]